MSTSPPARMTSLSRPSSRPLPRWIETSVVPKRLPSCTSLTARPMMSASFFTTACVFAFARVRARARVYLRARVYVWAWLRCRTYAHASVCRDRRALLSKRQRTDGCRRRKRACARARVRVQARPTPTGAARRSPALSTLERAIAASRASGAAQAAQMPLPPSSPPPPPRRPPTHKRCSREAVHDPRSQSVSHLDELGVGRGRRLRQRVLLLVQQRLALLPPEPVPGKRKKPTPAKGKKQGGDAKHGFGSRSTAALTSHDGHARQQGRRRGGQAPGRA